MEAAGFFETSVTDY